MHLFSILVHDFKENKNEEKMIIKWEAFVADEHIYQMEKHKNESIDAKLDQNIEK
jgi:hypothetical protein